MGFAGISIGHLLVVLVIVLLVFGTKRLKNIGSDLGGAIKGFKSALGGGDADKKDVEGAESEEAKSEEAKKVTAEKAAQQADLSKTGETSKTEQK